MGGGGRYMVLNTSNSTSFTMKIWFDDPVLYIISQLNVANLILLRRKKIVKKWSSKTILTCSSRKKYPRSTVYFAGCVKKAVETIL